MLMQTRTVNRSIETDRVSASPSCQKALDCGSWLISEQPGAIVKGLTQRACRIDSQRTTGNSNLTTVPNALDSATATRPFIRSTSCATNANPTPEPGTD